MTITEWVVGIVVLTFAGVGNETVPPDYTGKPLEDSVYKRGPQVIPGKVEFAYYHLGSERAA